MFPAMKFEFDPAKSASNKVKHGLDFVEAQRLWKETPSRVRILTKVSDGETRYAVLGMIGGEHRTIIVTYRGDAIRIISARNSSNKEKTIYESNKNKKKS